VHAEILGAYSRLVPYIRETPLEPFELEHALFGLAELAAAWRSFSQEYLGPEQPDAVQHARDQHHKQHQKQSDRRALRLLPAHQLGMQNPPHLSPLLRIP